MTKDKVNIDKETLPRKYSTMLEFMGKVLDVFSQGAELAPPHIAVSVQQYKDLTEKFQSTNLYFRNIPIVSTQEDIL